LSILTKRNQAESFKVDEATIINSYNFSTKDYNVVEIIVNGRHGTMMNKRSTKSYYVISGTGTFEIDGKGYQVESGDIITVKPNNWLSINGQNLRALIISNPIFDANDEEWK